MSLGKRIKKLRLNNDLEQKELSAKINISQASLSAYEKENKKPSFEVLDKLSDFFNVSTDYLLGKTEYPNFRVIEKEELEEITGSKEVAEKVIQRLELQVNGKPFQIDSQTKEEILNFLKVKGYIN